MYALPRLILGVFTLAMGLAYAQGEKPARIALVIGNGSYATAPLPNPVNDARDMATALEAAGFTVIRRENASLKDMVLALREFGDKLGRSSTGLVYFAGHGLQVRGRNYLVPVDADIAREDEVAFAALDLAAVMEKLDSARNPVNLVILDACRNDPFGKRLQLAQAGLAQVDAPAGTLIAFATAPGSVAADGGGRNGLYTRHLLEQMRKPGAPVEETFRNVRAAVRKESAGRQIPWESTSLETHFAFHAAPPAPAKVAKAAHSPATTGKPRSVPASAPPALAAGDTWTYRTRDLLGQSERTFTIAVKEVRGTEVLWKDGAKGDLLGNFTRAKLNDTWRTYTPSTQLYVFPLNAGAKFSLKSVEAVEGDGRIFDHDIAFDVVGEEEVTVPAGTFRAVKLVRTLRWTQRGKPEVAGTNTYTYWYSGQAKRWVAQDQRHVSRSGKETQRRRVELESYSVRQP